ncbi:MAG: hypothetical protein J6M23_06475 [Bacteroidales bacterium]|nr:hypothetical protein [Bacteroidales bacterium]
MNKKLLQKINNALARMESPALRERLTQELDWFDADPGRGESLLLLNDLAARMRTRGVVLSPGYSYLPDSLLLFLAGVHAVNPCDWDLPFERFTRSFHSGCTVPIETGTGGLEAAREVLQERDGALVTETEPGRFDVTFLDGAVFDRITLQIVIFKELDRFQRTVTKGWRPLDEGTLRLFGRGSTEGAPWFETDKMREWLTEFGPESMSDLVLLNALYHPDRIALYPEVLRRRLESDYGKSFRDTYGVPVYQEQVFDPKLALKGHTIARTMMAVEALHGQLAHSALK